ncbi:MAG: hypothetical protein WBO17_02285 [Sphingorhabdus sp.]
MTRVSTLSKACSASACLGVIDQAGASVALVAAPLLASLLLCYLAGVDMMVNKGEVSITTPAQLVRRGNELRIAFPPDGASANATDPDPALVR